MDPERAEHCIMFLFIIILQTQRDPGRVERERERRERKSFIRNYPNRALPSVRRACVDVCVIY